jgi:hypothetical protein
LFMHGPAGLICQVFGGAAVRQFCVFMGEMDSYAGPVGAPCSDFGSARINAS